jgi:hypothetical protein
MPKMLRDAAGNLYGWNDTMARMKGVYTIVEEDGSDVVPLADTAIVGPTEVYDYEPGKQPPTHSLAGMDQDELLGMTPPLVTEVQPTPDNPVEVVKPAAKRSRSSSKKSVVGEQDPAYDDGADGGGFGAE